MQTSGTAKSINSYDVLDLQPDPWWQVILSVLSKVERSTISAIECDSAKLLDHVSQQTGIELQKLVARICELRGWKNVYKLVSENSCAAHSQSEPSGYPLLTCNPFDSQFKEQLVSDWALAPQSLINCLSENCASSEQISPCVLLVDDDLHFTKVLQRYLQREGFSCICASTEEQALAILRTKCNEISLIICDVHLSETGTAEAQSFIREMRKLSVKPAPVIMLTSDTSSATKAQYIRSGAQFLLHKQSDPRLITAYARRFTRPLIASQQQRS